MSSECPISHVFPSSFLTRNNRQYCGEEATTREPRNGVETFWLDNCGLTGGSSGGPWIKDFDPETGSGKIISVNSWSYGSRNGMGGPIIDEAAARCLANAARQADYEAIAAEQPDGEEGIFVNCYDRPCIPEEDTGRRTLRGGYSRKLCQHKGN